MFNDLIEQLKDNNINKKELKVKLRPFKVNNAIIMAAGMSSRFAPLSYDKPKGLTKVKGEILIERQIRQLQEVGIKDIIIVTGYLKSQFQYLKNKYDVTLVNNKDYFKYNNTSSLMLVLDKLRNTYICSSDNYFEENPFSSYEYQSYYPVKISDNESNEYYVDFDKNNLITSVNFVSGDYYMIGHVYFDNGTSSTFKTILQREYQRDDVKEMLWEKLYIEFLDEIDLYAKVDTENLIHEFDSFDELRAYDNSFINYQGNEMLNNIANYFKVEVGDIKNISDVQLGLTNNSFKFEIEGHKYIYRHPGFGTEKIINRKAEKQAQEIASKINLDDSYIYMDANKGYKISHYLDHCRTLDYHNEAEVEIALRKIKTLHDKKIKVDNDFDIWKKTLDMKKEVNEESQALYSDYEQLYSKMHKIKLNTLKNDTDKVLCHCDFFNTNVLFQDEKSYVIDWEYAGNDDPACDLGIFVASSDLSFDRALKLLDVYEGKPMDQEKKQHFLSYYALGAYYCFIWALYQETNGSSSGEFLKIWHDNSVAYADYALSVITN